MILTGAATRVFLAPGATDLRKSFDGLSCLVQHRLQQDPLSGHLFLFANAQRNRIKGLYWDGSGLWVCAKRLGKGRFSWPKAEPETVSVRILAEELAMLLGGIDLERSSLRPWHRQAA